MKLKCSYPSLLFVLALTLLMSRAANALCIGNNYEQQIPSSNTFLPVVNVTNAPTTIATHQTIILTAEANVDINKGGKSSFYWCADGGYLEKDPSSPNYNSVKFTAPASIGETIKIGVQVGDGLGYIDTRVITMNVTQQSVNSCVPTLVYDNQVTTYPSDTMMPGTVLTQEWRLKNDSNCDANGYRLAVYPHNATFNGYSYTYQENTMTQNSFSIASNERDYATAGFYAPHMPGTYRLFFDIVDTNGNPLEPLSEGRLYSDFEVIAADTTTPSPMTGSIRGYINPQAVRDMGGQWRSYGMWREHAVAETGYQTQDYPFECKPVMGWIAPPTRTISVMSGQESTAVCNYTRALDAGPAGDLTVTYENEQFYLKYSVNDDTDYLEIDYSFSSVNWTNAFAKPISFLKSGNQPVSINGATDANVLYFRLQALNTATNETFIGDVISMSYDATPIIIVEPPNTPELFGLGIETYLKKVELRWQKIINSNYQDNVEAYEVRYANNSGFDNATQRDIGNPATGTNIYEVIEYLVTGLQDDTTYYFSVRAHNSAGTSGWSNTESIAINAQDFPAFNLAAFQPQDGATGISKQPKLCFPATDADGDPLDYRIVIGTSPNKLHTIRAFESDYEGQSCLDFASEEDLPLLPNTTYYWQVSLSEQGKDNNHYGGEYIQSPLMQFSTVASGPDLAITHVELDSELKPNSEVWFNVTVTNQGNEKAKTRHIEDIFYIKNGSETPFQTIGGNTGMDEHLLPGAKEILRIKVKFNDEIETNNGITYDNVLIAGESQIRFQFLSTTHPDIELANDQLTYTLNYVNSGPVFNHFQIHEYGKMYDSPKPFWARMGKTLGIKVQAEDDVLIEEISIQQRLAQNDDWVTVLTQSHNRAKLNEFWELPIPTNIQLTHEAQIRVIIRDDQNVETIKDSELFTIYSNLFEATITSMASSYTIGNHLNYQIVGDIPNGIERFWIALQCGSRYNYIYTEDAQNIVLSNPYEWFIPNSSFYADSDCHLILKMDDFAGNRIKETSNHFIIQTPDIDGDGIPDDFDPDQDNDGLPDSYEAQYAFLDPNDPQDANADQDNDERSNLEEYLHGSDPQIPDIIEQPTEPTPPPTTDTIITDIAVSGQHSMVLDRYGRIWSWGNNPWGVLGDGTKNGHIIPLKIEGISNVDVIDTSNEVSLAVDADQTLWTWGSRYSLTPQPFKSNFVDIAAGSRGHYLALDNTAQLHAWGWNGYGRLGDGTTDRREEPVFVKSNIKAIAAGSAHSLAIDNNGDVWAWGYNNSGQLGNGTFTGSDPNPYPLKVDGISNVVAISAGNVHSLALDSNGQLWGWGSNYSGQLGLGSQQNALTPTLVKSNITKISAGSEFSLALDNNGVLWAWGANYSDQLGIGSTTPTRVMSEVVDIEAGQLHALALKRDNTLWAWGANGSGQLGDGTTEDKLSPVKIEFEGLEENGTPPPDDDDEENPISIPNNGDGNGDGILDSQQTNVVTLPSAVGDTYLTLAVNGCNVQNVKVKAEMEAGNGTPDGAYDFPQGLIEFELPSCDNAEVTVYYHGITDASNRTYRKYGPQVPGDNSTVDWYTLPATFGTANIGGQTVATASFTLNDNQLGDDTGKDNLIVDIGGAAKTACLIYGLQDAGKNDSYLFTLNPTKDFELTLLGQPHLGYDLEALDRNTQGKLYASSGDDTKNGLPKGHLYQVHPSNGSLTSIGDICFAYQGEKVCGAEVSAITFHPDDSLWGWAENYGLIAINLANPNESNLAYSNNEERFEIEALTWNTTGETLYGIDEQQNVWRYDNNIGLQQICTLSGGATEALESLPDNMRMAYKLPPDHDLLMCSPQNAPGAMTIRALEANAHLCQNRGEINFTIPNYNKDIDIEGLVWACDVVGH